MLGKTKNDLAVARAFGRGEWEKVIELVKERLDDEEHKQFSYSMIGVAYENMEDYRSAKKYYALAIGLDECCEQALEGLARVYVSEKNYDLAYHYVLQGLNKTKSEDYKVPKVIKFMLAVVLKVLRPSRPFSDLKKQMENVGQSRNNWVKWAQEYKNWYEANNQDATKNQIH